MVQDSGSSEEGSHASVQARRQLDDAKQFLQSGNYVEAQDACRELLGEHAEYVGALYTLGRAYVASNDHNAALPCFIRASMLSPHEPPVFVQLALVYFNLGAGEAALQTAELSLSMAPEDALAGEAHLLLGRIYEQRDDYEQAREHLEQARDLNPELNDAAALLCRCLLELGEWDKSASAYKSALEGHVSPMDRAQLIHDLASQGDGLAVTDLLGQIDALADEASSLDGETDRAIFNARLMLAKAAILERQGKQQAAWEALLAGNDPMGERYAQDHEQARDQDKYTLERAAGWIFAGGATIPLGYDPPVSLFLLGASRAGKSTLERLIRTIEGSRAGYESDIVHAVCVQTSNAAGLMALRLPGQLPLSIHGIFTKNYADALSLRAPAAKLFTITHPDMITDLGRIAETVPNMRVVFMDRDDDDTALRIFAKAYPPGVNQFAYDVPGIYRYLEGYKRLSDTWSERLPGLTMRVGYDDMIRDPRNVVERIADFCGLPAPKGKLPELGDDRGCAKPYLGHLKKARSS